ncbi:hypothetical protein IEQ34_014700 [Dendrobium chrysotoxum]|uniref:Tobamovirus multiplication protein 2A n=1 Tax=Dendrobium chrysotoxum TaxID=161865 RepID=A0AAV7GM64_DENCH|nr:hypothetical protein IEQ34_014700 [Dendrobium chrysotoxum]
MACRGFLECLLKLFNFLLSISGLAMIGYGIYLLIEWNRFSPGSGDDPISPVSDGAEVWKLGRPMLLVTTLSNSFLDKLPTAWFIYVFIGIGAILFLISFFGCIGAVTRNGCCLSFVNICSLKLHLIQIAQSQTSLVSLNQPKYAFLVILLILLELGAAAFIFFDHDWTDLIPHDKTRSFDMIYGFIKENWKIVKWVALGAVVLEVWFQLGLRILCLMRIYLSLAVKLMFGLYSARSLDLLKFGGHSKLFKCENHIVFYLQALVFLLAILVRAANLPADYDSDDEYIATRSIRQPLINRQGVPATGVPLTATLDQRPSRNDAWSQRMREKYGLDTSEFTYNPSDPNRFQQGGAPQTEERGRCTIL